MGVPERNRARRRRKEQICRGEVRIVKHREKGGGAREAFGSFGEPFQRSTRFVVSPECDRAVGSVGRGKEKRGLARAENERSTYLARLLVDLLRAMLFKSSLTILMLPDVLLALGSDGSSPLERWLGARHGRHVGRSNVL